MRDVTIARRALLALSASLVAAALPLDAALAAARRPHSETPRRRIIALDPGHGGVDPGAISPHGLYEKHVTLAVARELAGRLDRTGRYRTILTRQGDRFVSLRRRVARARAGRAELFLSLHANALPDSARRGLSVYTLSDSASDSDTAALAKQENRDDFVAGLHLPRRAGEVGAILLDLARRDTGNRSLTLARTIVDELRRVMPLIEPPHRVAGFVVLTAPDMPSALVELGCLSNPQDEALLRAPAQRRQLAQGLVRAIDDYFAAAIHT